LEVLRKEFPYQYYDPSKEEPFFVLLVDDLQEENCEKALNLLAMSFDFNDDARYDNTQMIVGFDAEYLGADAQNTGFIQLSSNNLAVVFDLRRADISLPIALKHVLQSGQCIKTGSGIERDALQINQKYDVTFGGGFDLSVFVNTRKMASGRLKLSHIARDVLGIDKAIHTHSFRNKRGPLSEQLIRYAAKDAWLAYKILHTFFERLNPSQMEFFDWAKKNNAGFEMKKRWENENRKYKSVKVFAMLNAVKKKHESSINSHRLYNVLNKKQIDQQRKETNQNVVKNLVTLMKKSQKGETNEIKGQSEDKFDDGMVVNFM